MSYDVLGYIFTAYKIVGICVGTFNNQQKKYFQMIKKTQSDYILDYGSYLQKLIVQWEGMNLLYKSVKDKESDPDSKYIKFRYGNLSQVIPDSYPQEWIEIFFHWYAISACQFCTLIAKYQYQETQHDKFRKDVFLDENIKSILIFRDKIAAHYAGSTYNKHDTYEHKKLSVLSPLSRCDGKFFVGGYKIKNKQDTIDLEGNKKPIWTEIPSWSLTEEHSRIYKIMKKYLPKDWQHRLPNQYLKEFA